MAGHSAHVKGSARWRDVCPRHAEIPSALIHRGRDLGPYRSKLYILIHRAIAVFSGRGVAAPG
jgi:hypothetical protein